MALIADIFITHKPTRGAGLHTRDKLFNDCLRFLRANTDKKDYRLHIILDGDELNPTVREFKKIIDTVIQHQDNQGLGPSINQALAHIQSVNQWFEHPTHGDPEQVAPFVCYIQDDVLVTPGWLPKMAKFFMLYEQQYRLGFASGVESVEHATQKDLGNGMLLKPWIRAASMFGRREYWMSMAPIPRLDPETGRVRAKPNDGMGSGVDWWFVRNHQNSIVKSGKTCLVFPGMMAHAGYADSTWLKRELPESDLDKQFVSDVKTGQYNLHGHHLDLDTGRCICGIDPCQK